MQYRKFGKLDWEVSVLGFGAMRMPVIDEDQANIDEPEAIRMIRYAADHGVNYIDTAYLYHMGKSEGLVGKALKDGYRERMKVTTKLPVRDVEKYGDMDRILNEQLERLDMDHIDFYLLHGLNKEGWTKIRDLGVFNWAEKQMAAGLFSRLGFSFHDDYDVFQEIVDAYDDWVLAQVLYNFMDRDEQAGRRGVEYATGKGLAVVVMEPLRGGLLGKEPPEPVAREWDTAPRRQKPVEWALQWVWDQPEISMLLSGMSTMEQVVENVEIAGRSRTNMLTGEELALFDRVRETYRGLRPVPCTACRYCMPCPQDVDIPGVFQIYNDAVMYDDIRVGKFMYNGGFRVKPEQRADKCIVCGECVEKCPQQIAVPDWLAKAHEALYEEVPPPPTSDENLAEQPGSAD